MISFEHGLYVRVEELSNGPTPFPLKSGFSADRAYRVLGIFNASESSEAYFILTNDNEQMWFISNRHLRFVGISKKCMEARFELPDPIPFNKNTMPKLADDFAYEHVSQAFN